MVPYKPVYILNPAATTDIPGDVLVCIRLNDDTVNEFAAVFKRIRSAAFRFFILFDVQNKKDEAGDLLIHSLFCLNYYTGGGNALVAFPDNSPVIDDLSERLNKQGFHDITVWWIGKAAATTTDVYAPLVFPATASPGQWATETLMKDFESLTNFVIIDAPSSAAAAEIDDELRRSCNALPVSPQLFSDALRNYLSLQKENGELLSLNRKLSGRLAGTEKTIGVIRTKYKDDYENLFAWYHHEYEILPLWYKRFGHIIKVIMGKRTFRSLFSDDVKKYKH